MGDDSGPELQDPLRHDCSSGIGSQPPRPRPDQAMGALDQDAVGLDVSCRHFAVSCTGMDGHVRHLEFHTSKASRGGDSAAVSLD
jgi:hypothetical protein